MLLKFLLYYLSVWNDWALGDFAIFFPFCKILVYFNMSFDYPCNIMSLVTVEPINMAREKNKFSFGFSAGSG